MKKIPLLFITVLSFQFFLPFGRQAFSQGGVWTWINGDTTTSGFAVYGTKGIPSTVNHPRGFYEAIEWKDKMGNLWIYGGVSTQTDYYNDLWKFDPITREWAWMHGSGVPVYIPPVYGTLGVSSPLNTPGSRGWGGATWADTSGNLWLFGGGSSLNDLWIYSISSNEWTCVRGPTAGYFGTNGVPSILNDPVPREESASTWTDLNNNLWLFGGYGNYGSVGAFNDLWRYSIASNEWTWMNGADSVDSPGNPGIKNVPDPNNCPSGRWSYSRSHDLYGNFYMMGGFHDFQNYNDLWKYIISTNEWVWLHGSQIPNDYGNYLQYCTADSTNEPSSRFENRSTATDNCGRFWMFGGADPAGIKSDLWVFDPVLNVWKWISGPSASMQPANYGVMGIASPSNRPPYLAGGNAWWGNDNRFYLFSGSMQVGVNNTCYSTSAMWMFTPDTNCLGNCNQIVSNFLPEQDSICPGSCIDFLNLCYNASSYQWFFPGAAPDTSTALTPTDICYTSQGTFDVTLIASNANGSDTLILANYITVYPQPPQQGILQAGDTLFAVPGSASYQWYFNGNIINGATDYFYIAVASGDYNVIATDGNGCEVEAVINNVIAGLNQFPVPSSQFAIFPNPVTEQLSVKDYKLSGSVSEISVYNMIGEKILLDVNLKSMTVNCRLLKPGIYFLELSTGKQSYRSKFIKE
jgi:hypothetical protein